MLSLCISTSTDAVSVALGDFGAVVASTTLRGGKRHAETLVPTIEQLLRATNYEITDVGIIGLDVGPGLFTGLRVGIATASALAQSLNVNVVELCSLDVLAEHVKGLADRDDLAIWTALDARRSEIFFACHRIIDRAGEKVLERVVEPTVGTIEDLAEAVSARGQQSLCLGSGVQRYIAGLKGIAFLEFIDGLPDLPEAEAMVAMVNAAALRENYVNYGHITPLYLRAPDAEINWVKR